MSDSPSLWRRFRALRWYWQVVIWLLLPPLPVVLLAVQTGEEHKVEAWVAVAVMTVVWLVAIGTSGRGSNVEQPVTEFADTPTSSGPTASTTSRPSASPSSITSSATPTTAAPVAPAPTTTVGGSLLDGITVAAEANADSYDRERFGGWVDADGDGCDTRCEVLESEQRQDGTWYSPYDDYTTQDPSELEVDHMVPLAEAWRSGASEWDDAHREAFANDLAHDEALLAVTVAINRSKGGRDPGEWQPPNTAAWCDYARDWASVKRKWGLTIDGFEARALLNMTARC